MRHDTRARVRERVARLSEARLDIAAFLDEATGLLASAVPHEAGCWHTMDPASLIETGLHATHMPPPDARVAELAYLSGDYNSFVGLAGARRHSGVLSEATEGRLDRSPRYRELLRPVNVTGELRAALVVDGACWGCFALFREAPGDFTEDERDFAHAVAPLLGRGLRTAGVHARTVGDAAALWPGVLLLDRDGRVESITGPARAWLDDLDAGAGPEPLPFALLAVAERVRRDGGQASTRVLGGSGRWVQLHGSPATGGGSGRVAIVLQAASPPSVAPLISAAYGFTARERELTDLVLRGWDTAEIASRLFISRHTVQGHLKSIFAKAGVRSRRELVTRVFGPGAA
ncbi:helix-turn-helix domain-containing protein [Pseudonocardia acaciae]|uniref:helix-turn-helix domain-containing protein n=1 Tax=Pseudonocardia acaciae TaxID=551276 RepID=UPI0006870CD2|nr:helix-turn-helix transcriptional regulator [Pseudonocardia acaciae]